MESAKEESRRSVNLGYIVLNIISSYFHTAFYTISILAIIYDVSPISFSAKYYRHLRKVIAGFHSRDELPCFSTETKGKACI